MLQQVGLGDPLGWFDWAAAAVLALAVVWQGYQHFNKEKGVQTGLSADLRFTHGFRAGVQPTQRRSTSSLRSRHRME